MTITVTGVAELNKQLRRLGINADKAVGQGVFATASQVRNEAVKSIQAESMGTWVKRYSQSGKEYDHVASKPGSAPNTDTGTLVRSIAVEQPDTHTALVGSGLDYALFLEMGTTRMDPRPWLEPALAANIKKLPENISKAIQRAINERK